MCFSFILFLICLFQHFEIVVEKNKKGYNQKSAILAKKCLLGLVPNYFNEYFKLNDYIHDHSTKTAKDIHMPKVKLEIAKRLFYYSGAAAYHKLPKRIKESLFGFFCDCCQR